uniref:Uncharacterized protein n=1 Tax=Romanomermis culicivorax TaxID=13658 RepID=A0A915KKA2_ROMCU
MYSPEASADGTVVTCTYGNETKQSGYRTKSDILDPGNEPTVWSGQLDEDIMELESEEEVDSGLLGEESCKQVNNKDALFYISIADPEVAKSGLTASSVMQLQSQP